MAHLVVSPKAIMKKLLEYKATKHVYIIEQLLQMLNNNEG